MTLVYHIFLKQEFFEIFGDGSIIMIRITRLKKWVFSLRRSVSFEAVGDVYHRQERNTSAENDSSQMRKFDIEMRKCDFIVIYSL